MIRLEDHRPQVAGGAGAAIRRPAALRETLLKELERPAKSNSKEPPFEVIYCQPRVFRLSPPDRPQQGTERSDTGSLEQGHVSRDRDRKPRHLCRQGQMRDVAILQLLLLLETVGLTMSGCAGPRTARASSSKRIGESSARALPAAGSKRNSGEAENENSRNNRHGRGVAGPRKEQR